MPIGVAEDFFGDVRSVQFSSFNPDHDCSSMQFSEEEGKAKNYYNP